MNRRQHKKIYKNVLRAKDALNTWDGDLFAAIAYAYVYKTRTTPMARAIRMVINADAVMFSSGWHFMLPSTREAMDATDTYKIRLIDYGYEPDDKNYGRRIVVDMKRFFKDTAYQLEMLADDTAHYFLRNVAMEDDEYRERIREIHLQ